jgi:hypothetical protein
MTRTAVLSYGRQVFLRRKGEIAGILFVEEKPPLFTDAHINYKLCYFNINFTHAGFFAGKMNFL